MVSWTAAFPHSSSISVLFIERCWPPLIIVRGSYSLTFLKIDWQVNRKFFMHSSIETHAEPSYDFFFRQMSNPTTLLSFIIKTCIFNWRRLVSARKMFLVTWRVMSSKTLSKIHLDINSILITLYTMWNLTLFWTQLMW